MAFNERGSLEGVVREVREALARTGRPFEILVVDDGSSDGSGELADGLAGAVEGVRVIHHPRNLGLGAVYRTGFAEARQALLTFYPADGQFPASIIESFLPHTEACDLVLGYLPERRDSRLGIVLSALERLVYRALFGHMPRFQGIFMVRRAVLDGLRLTSRGRGWAVVMEMIIRVARSGRPLTSLPTQLRPRLAGKSKARTWRALVSNVRQLLALSREL